MAAKNLTDLYPHVLPSLPGAVYHLPLLLQTVKNVFMEFCHKTQVWTYDIPEFPAKEDIQEYLLIVPSYTTADVIKSAYNNKVELDAETGYTMPFKDRIRLVYAPSADTASDETGLEIEVVLIPKLSNTIIPEDIFNSWYMTLVKGIKAEMMMMPNKAWSNPALGQKLEEEFYWGKAEVRVDQEKGGLNVDTVAMPDERWA